MSEGASLEGRFVDPKIAPAMLRLHALLLGSKQRLLQHALRRASAAEPDQRPRLQARAAELEQDLVRLHASRLQWALLAPPSYPDYWVASYDSLVTLTEELLQEMQSELPKLTERTRRELMLRDIPELRQQLVRYRAELRRWSKARLRANLTNGEIDPPEGEPHAPFPVLDGLENVNHI
jgi:hypothetical protein